MGLRFTKKFFEVLKIAEELRKEEGLSLISEMNMLTAEYMGTNSILVKYSEERGIPEGILEEVLADINNEAELSDEEIEGGWTFTYNTSEGTKKYGVSKTVKETIFQAGLNTGGIVDIGIFISILIRKQTYLSKVIFELEKYATVSTEELNKNLQKNPAQNLQKSLNNLKSELERLNEYQKKLQELKRKMNPSDEESQQQPAAEPQVEKQEGFEPTNTEKEQTSQTEVKRTKPKRDEKAIPKKLEGCLTLMNEKIQKGEACEILGRDYETREIEKVLLKTTKRNAVLIGDGGVGKTAIVEKLVWDIVNEQCPEQLKNQRVISLNVNGIIAGTKFRGEAEERFKLLIEFLEKNPDVILFIDEMHGILGAGSASESNMDLGNALKPILARGQTRVIGATTLYEYEKYFTKDPALKRRFEKVIVKEPKTFEVHDMIKNKVRKLEDSHEVLISKELVDFCIYAASCYKPDVKNPDRTLDLIDTSMALANIEGTNILTKEIILKNFEKSMDILEETPQEIKESTAYHEAGHYLLGMYSDALASQKTIAVTIIPYEGEYMGANVYEPTDGFKTFLNKDYFIQEIASLYAGRIAEEMKTGYITVGARSDVERATQLAKNYVTKYAMSENISTMRVYAKKDKEDVVYLTEEKAKQIDEEINEILKESYELAEKVLNEHKEELDKLSQELLCKAILSEAEIRELLGKNEAVNS